MHWPVVTNAPPKDEGLSEPVSAIYDEAAAVEQASPRAASALLRLCLELLLEELKFGDEGDNLFARIGKAFADGDVGPTIQQAADVVRVSGNHAIHAGEISSSDSASTAAMLFVLVNMISHRLITEPRLLEAEYDGLPEGKRDGIENRDRRQAAQE